MRLDYEARISQYSLICFSEYTAEDAIDHIGFGKFQIRAGAVTSLTWVCLIKFYMYKIMVHEMKRLKMFNDQMK